MGIRKSFSIKPLSSEGKKALKKSVSIEVIQQTDDAVFQKTLSITKFLCENFLQKSFNLLECPTPNPYAGYSTGILIDTIGERGFYVYTKWGVMVFVNPNIEKSEIFLIKRKLVQEFGLGTTYRSNGMYTCKDFPESKMLPSWERCHDCTQLIQAWKVMVEDELSALLIETLKFEYQELIGEINAS